MVDSSFERSHTKILCIAVVAHDAKKQCLVDWVAKHLSVLEGAKIYATGTTGTRVQEVHPSLDIIRLKSGPLGGDQQIGALIAEGQLDALIFFVDPLSPMPHDVDVKALTRLAIVYNLPMACSPSTADYVIRGIARGT